MSSTVISNVAEDRGEMFFTSTPRQSMTSSSTWAQLLDHVDDLRLARRQAQRRPQADVGLVVNTGHNRAAHVEGDAVTFPVVQRSKHSLT